MDDVMATVTSLELFMTTNDLLSRCIQTLDQAPTLTESEQQEAKRLQMLSAQILDIPDEILKKRVGK